MKNQIKKIIRWFLEVQNEVNEIQSKQMFGKF
jgi:hypothetical protein